MTTSDKGDLTGLADDIHPAVDAHYRMDESTETPYA